jgi:hypothetical protein
MLACDGGLLKLEQRNGCNGEQLSSLASDVMLLRLDDRAKPAGCQLLARIATVIR